jgi:uncharacterized protein DUF6158
MDTGIPAGSLSDDDLRRELQQLDVKQADIQRSGTEDQKANHASRSSELQAEADRRFGESGQPNAS